MKRLYLLFISLALFGPSVVFAQGTEILEPAEYKPPQVGTRLEYSNWACTVEEVDGFRTKCRLDEGGSVTLFAWLQVEGKMPRSGYFADRSFLFHNLSAGGALIGRIPVLKASFEKDDLEAIASLWPMEVGKVAQFTDKFSNSGRVFSTASVESTELVKIDGARLRAFVIKVHGRIRMNRADQTEFMRRLWYSPDLGIVVKEEFGWTKGVRKGRRFDYVLRSVRLADGTSLVGSPPQIVSVREVPRASQESPLASAEYVAPEVGTRIEYSNWACTVEEVDGFATKCRLDRGGLITLHGWLEIDGNVPRSGYFADRSYVYGYNRKIPITLNSLRDDDQDAIEEFWPLKLGKEAEYKVGLVAGVRVSARWTSKARVEAIESLRVANETVRTFVIDIESKGFVNVFGSAEAGFRRRLWYSPDLGLVVKEEFEWTAGPRRGQRYDSALRSAQLPDGTSLLGSPTQIVSIRKTPSRSIDEPAKPRVSRDALPPAEYKAPQVGARIEYSNWACTVEEVDLFKTKCRLDEGGSATLFAWLEIEGDLPRSGYFADRWAFLSGPLTLAKLGNDDRRIIEDLWPLKDGKQIQYEVGAGAQTRVRLQSKAFVESTEPISIGGASLGTFLIRVEGNVVVPAYSVREVFTKRLWYAPDLGIVVKEEFEFRGRRSKYELRSIRLADGTMTFPPPVATPVASVEPASIEERLESVQDLLEQGLITKEEAADKRQEILDEL